MKYYTHIALGILLYTLLTWLVNQPFTIAGILFTAWISIMPDLIEKAIGEHRSWGHSIIWLIPIVASFFFNIQLGIAFASGFLGHIFLDIITKKGVAFFYPFNKTRFVMPKKEKSRIQTGSKQEKALCLVIILILVPLAYGVVHGMPDYAEITGNNSTLGKITGNNSTLGDLIKKITGNLKGNNSNKYPNYKSNSNYTPYQKTKATDKTTAKITPNTTVKDDTSSLIDWLTDNPQSDDKQTQNNNNHTNQTNSTNSTLNDLVNLLDPLFDDLSGTNNTEQNITMEDDSADYIPNNYNPGDNPDADYDDSGSDESSDDGGSGFDFFFTIIPIVKVV